MTSRDESLRALEKAVELVAKSNVAELDPFGGHVSAKDGDIVADCYYNAAHENDAEDVAIAIAAAVNFIREHGAVLLSDRQEVAPVADAVEVLRQKLANDEDGWRALCVVMAALPTGQTSREVAPVAIQEGWALVPIKPTDKQWDEGWHVFHTKAGMDGEEIAEAIEEAFGDDSAMDGLVGDVYKAMIAAAPAYAATCRTTGQWMAADPAKPGADETVTLEIPTGQTSDARDAARYRWLRDRAINFGLDDEKGTPYCVYGIGAGDANPTDGEELDNMIDHCAEIDAAKEQAP